MSNSEGWELHSQNGVRLNKICCLHSLKLWHLKSDLLESNCSIFTEVNRDSITIQIHTNACGLAEDQPLPGFIKTKHILSSTVAAIVVHINIIIITIREDMGVITALRLSKQNRAVKDMATAYSCNPRLTNRAAAWEPKITRVNGLTLYAPWFNNKAASHYSYLTIGSKIPHTHSVSPAYGHFLLEAIQ